MPYGVIGWERVKYGRLDLLNLHRAGFHVGFATLLFKTKHINISKQILKGHPELWPYHNVPPLLASFPGLLHLQFLITCMQHAKTDGEGLGNLLS